MAGELRKMVEFIKKEADEKAKEIELKANEEYEIEKANIVRSETASIDQQYEKKYKQASLAQQITKSSINNKSRMKVLNAKEDALNDILEEARNRLKNAASDKTKYQKVLTGLVEEGLYGLMEESVRVRVRQADIDLAKKAIPEAEKAYKEKAKRDVKVELDEKEFLSKDGDGGVVVENGEGKIVIDNTFEERLKILSQNSLPQIRHAIFGPSPTRKFFD